MRLRALAIDEDRLDPIVELAQVDDFRILALVNSRVRLRDKVVSA
jgi:hypothetical protein